jgi:hypothetical protein
MPMAFNLFAEASLAEHEGSRRRLAELFGLTASTWMHILFEWSPARRSAKYTRDRTAFDVALCLGESRPRTVVGIGRGRRMGTVLARAQNGDGPR